MATDRGVTSLTGEGTRSKLLCGKPACDRVAETIIEFTWNGWSGVLGACWEHHEDLVVMALKAKSSAGEGDET